MSKQPTTQDNYNTIVNSVLQSYENRVNYEKQYIQFIEESSLALAKAIYAIKTSKTIPKEEQGFRAIAKKLSSIRYITHTEVMNLFNAYKLISKKSKRGGVRT